MNNENVVVVRFLDDIIKGDTALRLDKAAKLVLGSPEVAYRMTHTLIPEAESLSFEDFGRTYEPDFKHPAGPVMMPTEDTVPEEGTVYFDVLYSLYDGNGEPIALVDVEAQGKSNPGYDLKKRGAYYCARLISGQFKAEKNRRMSSTYKNLNKVYSIWILFGCGPETANRIIQHREQAIALYGEVNPKYDTLDPASLIMVYLPKSSDGLDVQDKDPYASLVAILASLFDENLDADEKCDKLKASGINLTEELKGDLIKMCNYSEHIALSAASKAYAKGETKGAYKESVKVALRLFGLGLSEADVQKACPDLSPDLIRTLRSQAAEK